MFQTYSDQAKKAGFSTKEVSYFLSGGRQNYEETQRTLAAYSTDQFWDPNLFNNGRVEWIKESIKHLPGLVNSVDIKQTETTAALSMMEQFQFPGSIHLNMFAVSIDLLGTETQRKEFLDKCYSYEIVGCYAQTEIGHGSDVQSLMTTATYDEQKEQFVINTPSIDAAKYWPGDMAIYANWALVHARCIIRGKDYGIQNFLVPIRDKDHKLLPGIQAGDIGPKWGFLAKDNGYMILNNVRISKKNLLRKYVKIENGVLIKKGNPKVGYATMMVVRRLVSGLATRAYGQSILIAGKYSFARRQFKDDKKEEIPIINYQLQQNKLISCLAEHFAILLGSNTVSKMTFENIERINRDDDSLMKETHNCLCVAKALFTELCLRGMEICRLACGGHGFSQYSGLPHIIQQFSPNVTLEGENTVLYLQLARYVMKAYTNSISKKKPLRESVRYVGSMEELLAKKCEAKSLSDWSLESVKLLLAQSVMSSIQSCAERLMSDENQKRAWNEKAGIRLQQVAHSHAVYWTFDNFVTAINSEVCSEATKSILTEVCLLFGINSLLAKLQPLIENSLISPGQVKSLMEKKESLLKSLRGNFAALLQSLSIPPQYQRSALTHGNIYQNLFNLAKKNPINNTSITPAVKILKGGLTNTRPRL